MNEKLISSLSFNRKDYLIRKMREDIHKKKLNIMFEDMT